MRLIGVALLVLGSLSASGQTRREIRCVNYRPGTFLLPADYFSVLDYFRDLGLLPLPSDTTRSRLERGKFLAKYLGIWNRALDSELGPALLEVFTNPRTRVIWGSYTDPAERREAIALGKPLESSENRDHGAGQRIIYRLQIENRLVSVLLFWTRDSKSGRLVPLGGPDGIRVRSEILPFKNYRDGNHLGWVALAYDLEVDDAGRVRGIEPLRYWKKNGERKQPWSPLNADTCMRCHEERRSQVSLKHEGKLLVDAKDLVPEGLVETLSKSCATLAARQGDVVTQLQTWLGKRDPLIAKDPWPPSAPLTGESYSSERPYLFRPRGGEATRVRILRPLSGYEFLVTSVDDAKSPVTASGFELRPEVDDLLGLARGERVRTVEGEGARIEDLFEDGTVKIRTAKGSSLRFFPELVPERALKTRFPGD